MDLSHTHIEKIGKHLENKRFESLQFHNSSHHHGFNSGPRNYFMPKVELRKFDGMYVFTWVNEIKQLFESHNIINDKQMIVVCTTQGQDLCCIKLGTFVVSSQDIVLYQVLSMSSCIEVGCLYCDLVLYQDWNFVLYQDWSLVLYQDWSCIISIL